MDKFKGKAMTRTALFAGVFDPVTMGHLNIIRRSLVVCDKLIVAVAINPSKKPLFSVEERLLMLHETTRSYPHVQIDSFSGLLVEYAKKKKIQFLLRGLRTCSDFEHESQMSAANWRMSGIDSVFFTAEQSHISSSLIREIALFGGSLKDLVPPEVEASLKKKFTKSD